MSKYTIQDVITSLLVTYDFKRGEVEDPVDNYFKDKYFTEWDQGDDPTGANTEISESTALGIVKHILKTKKITYKKDDAIKGLQEAHTRSLNGNTEAEIQKIIEKLDAAYNIGIIIRDIDIIKEKINKSYDDLADISTLDATYRVILDELKKLSDNPDPLAANLYRQCLQVLPELDQLLQDYYILRDKELIYARDVLLITDPKKARSDAFMSMFSKEPLVDANKFFNTAQKIKEAFTKDFNRPDNPPESIFPWELRLGASRFFVPPIDVKVSQQFKTGSLSGGAIRQSSSPKFNSGQSETAIQMTLYFPNMESIWGLVVGYEGVQDKLSAPAKDINFDDINISSDEEVDYFLSSLRGLIAQFKYAPFLPVKNQYLNQAWNITGVTLSSMSISTVENYPFCVAVTLNMMKFNHKVFLPMIEDFNQAIHWGKFRQYMGRAAKHIQNIYNVGFLTETKTTDPAKPVTDYQRRWEITGAENQPLTMPSAKTWFDNDKSKTHLEFYYPSKTSSEIFAPDDSMFRQENEDNGVGTPGYEEDKATWGIFLGYLGVDVDSNPESVYDAVTNYSQHFNSYKSEWDLMFSYLRSVGYSIQDMKPQKLNEYMISRIKDLKDKGIITTPESEEEYKKKIRGAWYDTLFAGYRDTAFYREYLADAQLKNGVITIKEWEVPMDKLPFDEKSIFVQGITVSLSNNFAKLQVQLHDEPTYQHIGGGDSRLDVSMIIIGEDNLIRIRRMFDRVGGLARLEHAHGVLGFLGIKNELTGLAGIKYLIPLTYEADSVPGYPRVYNVRLSFLDFDVFQQKKEKLSSEQQRELVELFGKRNPFLRIKQAWGRFNAYPDFPLTIKDEDNIVVGTLDPDYYFRSFKTIDDDTVQWGNQNNTTPENTTGEGGFSTGPNGELVTESTTEQDPNSNVNNSGGDDSEFGPNSPSTTEQQNNNSTFSPFGFDVMTDKYTKPISNTDGYNFKIRHHLITTGKEQDKTAVMDIFNGGEVQFGTHFGKDARAQGMNPDVGGLKIHEDISVPATQVPAVEGLTPGSQYQSPYAYGSSDPTKQYELMMHDTQYRDNSGRMVRAFPTYMLWLIDEGGRFGGVKLFDNFYGLQSVIDFSVNRSEDVLGDTLVLRLSNLYSKLSTPFRGFVQREDGTENFVNNGDPDPSGTQTMDDIANIISNRMDQLKSGTLDDYVVELDSIRLKPGVRVHLRMGYSANPNALDTVFNGVITQVQSGEIVEVIAQSDAIELSQYINTSNKKGHSGKIDGSINTGFWMSEPRDLMVRLLSMGSSSFKEQFAHATKGQIFSESRFGIRHFGSILYEPLNETEQELHAKRASAVHNKLQEVAGTGSIKDALGFGFGDGSDTGSTGTTGMIGGQFAGLLGESTMRSPMIGMIQSMWTNFFTKRDFELYKRNIYPGNGLGVAQFLGGDLLDSGTVLLEAAGVKGPDTQVNTTTKDFISYGAGTTTSSQGMSETEIWRETLISLSASGKRMDSLASPTSNAAPNPDAEVNRAGSASSTTKVVDDETIDLPTGLETLGNITGAGIGLPGFGGTAIKEGLRVAQGIFTGGGKYSSNPLLQAMGLVKPGEPDDDLQGFDEVSFRAQTYMKTVWDMFQLCAALLPNYVVAVRPFEDRSTIFYGKPHWLYTSGVIPLSTGVPKSDTTLKLEGPDDTLTKLLREASNRANPLADYEEQMNFMQNVNAANPATTVAGTSDQEASKYQDAASVAKLVLEQDGAKIPVRSGKVALGKHFSDASVRVQKPRNELIDLLIKKANDEIYANREWKLFNDDRHGTPERKREWKKRKDAGETILEFDEWVKVEKAAYQNHKTLRETWEKRKKILERNNEDDQVSINNFFEDPNVLDQGQRFTMSTSSDSHMESPNLEDRHKFNNFREQAPVKPGVESPEEEQYYISMRWPYVNWPERLHAEWESMETIVAGYDKVDSYVGKRVAIANQTNNKVVICVIAGEGPTDTGKRAVLSPDAYYALGLNENGESECNFGFVASTVKLGPTGINSPQGAEQPSSSSGGTAPNAPDVPYASPSDPNDTGARDYTSLWEPFLVTERLLEQTYPGRSYKNEGQRQHAFKELFEGEGYFKTSFLYGWLGGDRNDEAAYKENGPRQSGMYAEGLGHRNSENTSLAQIDSEANFVERYISGINTRVKWNNPNNPGNYDIVGEVARRIYDRTYNERRRDVAIGDSSVIEEAKKLFGYKDEGAVKAAAEATYKSFNDVMKQYDSTFTGISETEAESVWDQFRKRWHIRTDNEFKEVKEAAAEFIRQHVHISGPISEDEYNAKTGFDKLWWDGIDENMREYDLNDWEKRVLFSTNMSKIVNNFKMLLWRLPAARAWLAITTVRTTGWTPRPEFDFSGSEVTKVWKWYLGVNTDGDQIGKDSFSPDNLKNLTEAAALKDEKAFTELKIPEKVAEAKYEDIFKHTGIISKFVDALNRYNKPGQKGASDIEQGLETARKAWDKSVGAFFSMVSSAITGVVGMFRMSLMEMGYGMGMVGSMQQQANILNKAFNDSIYYSTGTPGSLTWLADNPFTREYGEPVVEVREPFQRIHYINSFQDILHNGIIENLNNVPTVITASSDGKYPVTVYFDKGASPEKQFETGVETGLFWDNARGSGFFGFLHPLLHPIETARGLAKNATGSSDELMSRRVALWHLKEGLKDIYQGEVLVLGRADIRPFDLIYLADVYERMYGIFEVEAVTHHFTSDTGFVTGIAPNALVSINDPGKWTMQSWVWGMLGVQDTRNHVRHLYSVYADKGAKAFNMDLNPPGTDDEGNVNMNALATAIEPTLRGNIQYTGGNSNLLKDMATHAGTGYLRPGNGGYLTDNEKIVSEIQGKINSPGFTFLSMVPGFGKVTDIIWDGWTWVRDNLLDQHGCYIQYLSKNGQPMDSGLSFNQGVAVGYHHSVNLLPGILNLEVKTTQNGHRRITANDIMSQLGWSEVDIVGVQQNVSWWNNYWNSKVLELSGHGPDPISLSPPTAYLAKVLEVDNETDYNLNGVIDGDTIKALVLDGPKAGKVLRFRFAGIDTPELEFKEDPLRNNQSSKAFLARQLVEKRLITDQVSQGFEPIVAIRESTGSGTPGAPTSEDKYGRTLAVIFHNAPGQPQDNDDRNNLLLKAATAWPLTQWDSFLADGRPYTINWELVMAGLAYTDMGGVARNDPDRGYTSTGRYIGGN